MFETTNQILYSIYYSRIRSAKEIAGSSPSSQSAQAKRVLAARHQVTLWLFNSSPWYRWPIEIDGLPNLEMVNLSMANCWS